jgi:hypothetical protein
MDGMGKQRRPRKAFTPGAERWRTTGLPDPAATVPAHARVEDRIRCGKDSGFGRFPSRQFGINAAWLELALLGIDLLAFARTLQARNVTFAGRL